MLTEKGHAFGFLISEADGMLSRDAGTLASGQNLPAGAVLFLSGGNWTEVGNGDEASAAAILGAACDASAGAAPCVVISRSAEVNGNELVWSDESPAVDQDAAIAALASGPQIIVR